LAAADALWCNSPVEPFVKVTAQIAGTLVAIWAGVRAPSPVPAARAENPQPISATAAPALTAVTAAAEPPTEPPSVPAKEVDAVVETKASRTVPANTPMGEDEAAGHLAAAWQSVVGTQASPLTLSLLWAHWAHETGRGQRMHAYNFAGIKGQGPSGASVVVWTREGAGPSPELVRRTFRAYRSPAEGARDYVRLLVKRYPSALRGAKSGNVLDFASGLESGGYFTGDGRAYHRALASLSIECRRRGIAAARP
jgi:flagellum-specific peptidoglycan hydrolase FlgJ